MIRKIGVLTSGGDAPGMNAAIRAVVRSGIKEDLDVYGVYDGYQGLHLNRIERLSRDKVAERLNRGGTFLGSARFPEFKEVKVREQAIQNLKMHGIDALVIIGGDGTYRGAKALTDMGFPCIGLPGTIDNDIAKTDYTIGYMTALDTILEAVDRLRDTSSSHQRISIVEVMGRHCGDLALKASIAGGGDFVITPETGFNRDELLAHLRYTISWGKKHAIVIITENLTNVNELAQYIEGEMERETRATVLGHIQRGGCPVGFDRILASQMGNYAVKLLLDGYGGRCVGIEDNKMVHHDITEVIELKSTPRYDLLELARKLY